MSDTMIISKNNTKKENPTFKVTEKIAGMVYFILDKEGNKIALPADIENCILRQPGGLIFFTDDSGRNCLAILTELGSVRFFGNITKREAGFITFSTKKYKIILEENHLYGESAFIGEQNFMAANTIRDFKEYIRKKSDV